MAKALKLNLSSSKHRKQASTGGVNNIARTWYRAYQLSQGQSSAKRHITYRLCGLATNAGCAI